MRALLDTNIFISYLLPSHQKGAIAAIVEAALSGAFTLLVPQELIEEFSRAVASKKYLARRISSQDADEFIRTLREVAEVIPSITDEIPAFTRDPKDDYLIAYALVGQADYIVSRDEDLLSLSRVEDVCMVNPVAFLAVLLKE